MPTRRDMLQDIARDRGPGGPCARPCRRFWPGRPARPRPERDGRVLVVIQLDGGNDAINTLVPFADEGYAKNRKQLRLPEKQLIQVNDRVGLHPALRELGALLERGQLAPGARGRLSQPQPIALREHGDLADGAARPGGAWRPGLDRPRPRRAGDGTRPRARPPAPPRCTSATERRRRPCAAGVPGPRRWSGSTTSRLPTGSGSFVAGNPARQPGRSRTTA